MYTLTVIIISLSIFSFISHADSNSCKSIRLDKSPGTFSNVPVTNQGSAPICFDHAAALIGTGYLRKNRPDLGQFEIAPEHLWASTEALPEAERLKTLSATEGRTCEALNLFKTIGICDKNSILDLLSRYQNYQLNNDGALEIDIQSKADEFRKDIMSSFLKYSLNPSHETCGQLEMDLRRLGVDLFAIKNIVNKTLLLDMKTIRLEALFNMVVTETCRAKKGWLPPLNSDRNSKPRCQKFDFDKIPNGSEFALKNPASFKKELNDLLDKQPNQILPIGIEYCSGIFSDSSKSYIQNRVFPKNIDYLNSEASSRNLAQDCGFHASVIIGREKKDGKCKLLIQNSWGASCNYYQYPEDCEGGKVWVDENDLTKNLLRISTLEE